MAPVDPDPLDAALALLSVRNAPHEVQRAQLAVLVDVAKSLRALVADAPGPGLPKPVRPPRRPRKPKAQ